MSHYSKSLIIRRGVIMAYDLEEITEVVRVLNLVEERKRQGIIYKTMASVVSQKLGKAISNGYNSKDTYQYEEKGLKVFEKQCFDGDSDYIGSIIDIRVPSTRNPLFARFGEIVFYSDAGDITTYRPGEWENRLKELYEPLKPKTQSIERKVEIPSITKQELQNLKERFGIE